MPCYFVHCALCGRDGHNRRTCGRTRSQRLQQRRLWARRSEQRRRDRRRAIGVCFRCGEAIDDQLYTRCSECRRAESLTKAKLRHGEARP
jgi:hypothetical protein